MKELTRVFLDLCAQDLGIKEAGKNRHPLIDEFNKYCGVPLGSPYCLSAIMYRLNGACALLGLKNPIPKIASTQILFNTAPVKYIFLENPVAGEIGIMQSRADPSRGHAFVVRHDKLVTDKTLLTLEYNTGPDLGRDGDGVYNKIRTMNGTSTLKMRGFIDLVSWVLSENGLES